MLNIHHIELFYYVARHGGIAPAVRNMPYGIQQPAISAQILALEDHLGVSLFRRRPFELSPAGRELFAFIEPFFGGLEGMEEKLRGGLNERLRVGASQTVLRQYLPGILRELRGHDPGLKLVLRSGYQTELEQMLAGGEIDLAVTVIDRAVAPGLSARILVELRLALMLPRAMKAANAEALLAADPIEHRLITLRPDETLCRMFQQELTRRGLTWPASIEAGTLELVGTYVAEGFGIGLGVEVPAAKAPPGLRLLPLDGFPRLPVGVLSAGRLPPVAQALVGLLEREARALAGGPGEVEAGGAGENPAAGERT